MNGDTVWSTIADHYRGKIDQGELRPGDALPGEKQVAKLFGVARGTARRALQELERTGTVTTGYRRTVAAPDPLVVNLARDPGRTWAGEAPARGADAWGADMVSAGREPAQHIEVVVELASPTVAARLQLPEGAKVVARKLGRDVDGQPHNLVTYWFPFDVADGTPLAEPASVAEGAIAWLERTHGPGSSLVEVSARQPERAEEAALRIPGGVVVLVVWRTSLSPLARPLMTSRAVYPADRATLRVVL